MKLSIIHIRKNIILILLLFLLSGCKSNVIETTSINNYSTDTCYGRLNIPVISLDQCIYSPNSSLNNVNKNIMIIETNIINTYLLAAHSGIGKLAYFNDLKYLDIGDNIFLDIDNNHNHYKIIEIKREKKSGRIVIKNIENMVYLTTCDQELKGYQLIIVGQMVK